MASVASNSLALLHPIPNSFTCIYKVTLPLVPNASANQPPIKHTPPRGVTGPKTFPNLCPSKTKA